MQLPGTMKSVIAVLFVLSIAGGCLSPTPPDPQDLPSDKLELIIREFNYNGTGWIRIDPVGDHHIGDTFVITAKTNLTAGTPVLVQTWPVSFAKSDKYTIRNGTRAKVMVMAGTGGINTISLDIDSTDFRQTMYLVSMTDGTGAGSGAPYPATSAAAWYNITAGM
jgi:hypothetical protein